MANSAVGEITGFDDGAGIWMLNRHNCVI